MDFKKKVIDGHFHFYNWYNDAVHNFYRAGEEYISEGNFRAININAMPAVEADVSNNIMCALFKLRHPENYAHGGIVYEHFPAPEKPSDGMDTATQYRELMEIGFDGIKILDTKPTVLKVIGRKLDDEFYEGLFENAEKDGTHFVWHVADPSTYWDADKAPKSAFDNGWFYGDGTFPSCEEIYRQVTAVLDRHPNLKVTFAHFFFMAAKPELLEEYFKKYPNVNIDLTPGTEMYKWFGARYDFYRDFFIRYADRIGYGTDCSDEGIIENKMRHSGIIYRLLTTDDDFDVWDYKFKGFKLPDEVVDKIVCGNFLRRVGEKPKPINVDALKRYFEKYRHLIADKKIEKNIENELQKL